jgi:hypothetical protein
MLPPPPPFGRAGDPFDLGDLLTQPRDRCEAAIRERCRGATLGDGVAVCRVLGRYRMFVDGGDADRAAALVLDGFEELPVTAAMLGCVRRGATAIDVGAGFGYHTLALGELAGSGGRVIAFEPDPRRARRARASIGVNGFAGTTMLHQCALGAADTEATRRLDSFPEALAAEVVRIGAAGEAQRIWRGMTGLLARGGPLTVLLAFHRDRHPDPEGFLGEIRGEGFAVDAIDCGGDAGARMLCLRR